MIFETSHLAKSPLQIALKCHTMMMIHRQGATSLSAGTVNEVPFTKRKKSTLLVDLLHKSYRVAKTWYPDAGAVAIAPLSRSSETFHPVVAMWNAAVLGSKSPRGETAMMTMIANRLGNATTSAMMIEDVCNLNFRKTPS